MFRSFFNDYICESEALITNFTMNYRNQTCRKKQYTMISLYLCSKKHFQVHKIFESFFLNKSYLKVQTNNECKHFNNIYVISFSFKFYSKLGIEVFAFTETSTPLNTWVTWNYCIKKTPFILQHHADAILMWKNAVPSMNVFLNIRWY